MPENTFNTPAGQTVERELLVALLNTGTSAAPVWSPFGTGVEDSSMEYDWQDESKKDILGNTKTTMRKPIIKQSFEPCELDEGDEALKKIWELAVKEQNAAALCNMDVLIVHLYSGTAAAAFAERYPASMVKPTGLGGEGGGFVGMPIEVTCGGKRAVGTCSKADGTYTFTEDTDA